MNKQHVLAQTLIRSWPFMHGAGRITDKLFSRLTFDDEVATVKTTDGFLMTVMPNELIGRHLYLSGEFDRSVAEVLLRHAQPGDTLLDIGANIGYISACFLQKVPDSSAIAVEPQPQIVSLLTKNLAQFDPRSKVFPVGLSDEDAVRPMEICANNRGASRLVQQKTIHTVEVQLWSAKRLFAEIDRRVDIIKIDAEGHEYQIISACRSELAAIKPRAILFEDESRSGGYNGKIVSILRDIGYHIKAIKKSLTRIDLVPIESVRNCSELNYIATMQPG